MKTLKFTIRDKHITRQDGNAVVAGAVNHYELECLFDEDWDGLTKNCCAGKRGREGGIAVHGRTDAAVGGL